MAPKNVTCGGSHWLGLVLSVPRMLRRNGLCSNGVPFFCLTLGLPMPWISPGTRCGCHAFKHDQYGDHACTCNTHGGAGRAHDWAVSQIASLFRSTGHTVYTQTKVTGVGPNRKQRGDIELVAYLPHPLDEHMNLVMDFICIVLLKPWVFQENNFLSGYMKVRLNTQVSSTTQPLLGQILVQTLLLFLSF